MLRLQFGKLLEKRGLTAYAVWKESGLARNTVYDFARADSERNRIDLDKLSRAVHAVETLSGKPVIVNEVIEVINPTDPATLEANNENEIEMHNLTTLFASAAKKLKAKPVQDGTPEGSSEPASVKGKGPSLVEIIRDGRT